jgi:hypothetical protein
VRPEAVELSEGDRHDTLAGLVARSTFLGDRTEVVIETEAGEVRADVDPRRLPKKGDRVRLRLRECRVFASP